MAREQIATIIDDELIKLAPDMAESQVAQLYDRGVGVKTILDLLEANAEGLVNPLKGLVDVKTEPLQAVGAIREIEGEHVEAARSIIKNTLQTALAQGASFNCDLP
jgi:hypothetical protein